MDKIEIASGRGHFFVCFFWAFFSTLRLFLLVGNGLLIAVASLVAECRLYV